MKPPSHPINDHAPPALAGGSFFARLPYPLPMDTITTYLTQYYGTDWLAVIFMCVYLWRIADKHRDAFIWGALSCTFFVALNVLIDSPPGIVFNALFCILNARAFIKWAAKNRDGNE